MLIKDLHQDGENKFYNVTGKFFIQPRNLGWCMVFDATFNNILAKSWQSVLLVEETGVPGENHRPAASRGETLSHNVESSTPRMSGVQTHNC